MNARNGQCSQELGSFPHEKISGLTILREITNFSQKIRVLRHVRPESQSSVGLGGCGGRNRIKCLKSIMFPRPTDSECRK